ncbi:Uncharacterised protein [Dermatophilus congolensis]|uniref:Uncharacterized protein n=1 Tax=Dermatophilus congolensis TaxID=1863 RepID=A0AA46H0K1_9MICO|nr:Uncharacterised protein [Dermatophilus congolensis]
MGSQGYAGGHRKNSYRYPSKLFVLTRRKSDGDTLNRPMGGHQGIRPSLIGRSEKCLSTLTTHSSPAVLSTGAHGPKNETHGRGHRHGRITLRGAGVALLRPLPPHTPAETA